MPVRFYVEQRLDFQDAKSFGKAGSYELILTRVVTDAGEGRVSVLKPRDPVLGNGTALFELNPKRKQPPSDAAQLEEGFTFVDLLWPSPTTAQQAVQQVLNYLKVTGGPMLLGDQPRFIKKVLAVNAKSWLTKFNEAGLNKGSKDRVLIDGEWPPVC